MKSFRVLMVGWRGEAPLVPPYILCNFKLDGAEVSSPQPTVRSGELGLNGLSAELSSCATTFSTVDHSRSHELVVIDLAGASEDDQGLQQFFDAVGFGSGEQFGHVVSGGQLLADGQHLRAGATGEGLRSPVIFENTGGSKQPPVAPGGDQFVHVFHIRFQFGEDRNQPCHSAKRSRGRNHRPVTAFPLGRKVPPFARR